jgi:hypothetical protein
MTDQRQLSPDGRWWWDGQQWQPVKQPPPQPPQPQPQPQPSQPPPSKRSIRLQLLIGFGGLVALLVLIGVIGSVAGGGSQQPATSTTAPTPPAAVAATATAAPTATPTAAPTAAPTPVPGPQIMMQQQGSGIANSTEFNAPSHWQLSYSYDCSNFGYQGNFQVYLYQGSRLVDILANDLGKGESKTTDVYRGGDHLHLQMNSECSWSVKAATA